MKDYKLAQEWLNGRSAYSIMKEKGHKQLNTTNRFLAYTLREMYTKGNICTR